MNIKLQQLLNHLSTRQKITYGYAVVLGVTTLGTTTGLSFSEFSQHQTMTKFAQAQAQAQESWLSYWQINRFQNIKVQASAKYATNLRRWWQNHEEMPDVNGQKLEAIWQQVNHAKVEFTAIQAIELSVKNFEDSEVAIAFAHLAKNLSQQIEKSQQEQQATSLTFVTREELQVWIVSASTSLLITVVVAIAVSTCRVLNHHKQVFHSFTSKERQTGQPVILWAIAHEITECQQQEAELRHSEARFRELANRETLLNQLANQIRNSLDLNTILDTAVIEIRKLLQLDRCCFFWYRPDFPPHWEIVQEAKNADLPSFINNCLPVTEIVALLARVREQEAKIIAVNDTKNLHNQGERNFFLSLGYSAVLFLPIHTQSGEIGIICCNHTSKPRVWSETEIVMLQGVGDQIAIAIDQAQLLQQSRLATATALEQATKLEAALSELQQAQTQLVQSEKMSSLGQLVAGIAHEINNPVSFIYGNITPIKEYVKDLLSLIQLYQNSYPEPTPEIQAKLDITDLDFIKADLPKILSSIKSGSDRICQIVLSLRNFSRLDEAEMKWVDIHEGLNNTLLVLSHRLNSQQSGQPEIQVIKDYGNLPKVQCYAGQLNQVFMNVLTNAIEAIEAYRKAYSLTNSKDYLGTILISTEVLDTDQMIILIGDNGLGMVEEVNQKIFDPFFTTKPAGSGTGLGLTMSYKIVVEKHGGQLQSISAPGQGTAILIQIPIQQNEGRSPEASC